MPEIQSVKRAFLILRAIASQPTGMRLSTIARAVDLPKSTISRMLSTLESIGVVQRAPDREGFLLGPAVEDLVTLSRPSSVAAIARPYLVRLAAEVGETASMCTFEKAEVNYLYQVQDPRSNIRIRDWSGVRVPMLHIASPGKLLLAFGPAEIRDEYLQKPLERYTEHTFDSLQKLSSHLEQIHQGGIAWVYEEYELGLVGVSAPIFNEGGSIIAAVNVYGPKFRFPVEGQKTWVELLVSHAAGEIMRQIGGTPPEHLKIDLNLR